MDPRNRYLLTRALAAFPPAHRFVELQGELGRALDTEAQELAARDARRADLPAR